jgi:hydroxymethylglutaryl-CoA lyase
MKATWYDKVIITDVTLREYGQNVPAKYLPIFSPEKRVETVLKLIDAGFTNVEVFSCVHPKIAPAMNAQALKKIAGGLGRISGVNLITLVPNRSGYKSFLQHHLGPDGYNHTMAIFFSAVEAHNCANLGKTIKETINEYKVILKNAVKEKIRVLTYISALFGYLTPDDNNLFKPDINSIVDYIDLFLDLGAEAVTLSDLQGVANEGETRRIIETILNKRKGRDRDKLGYHPHHVSGEKAIANSKVAFDLGIRRFDASLGGTGGCITGAPGNQPTEFLVHSFHKWGIETGIDEEKVFSLTDMFKKQLYNKIGLARLI